MFSYQLAAESKYFGVQVSLLNFVGAAECAWVWQVLNASLVFQSGYYSFHPQLQPHPRLHHLRLHPHFHCHASEMVAGLKKGQIMHRN